MSPNAVFWLAEAALFGALAIGFGWQAVSSRKAADAQQQIIDQFTEGGYTRALKDGTQVRFDRVVLEGLRDLHRAAFWASLFGVVAALLSAVAAWWTTG